MTRSITFLYISLAYTSWAFAQCCSGGVPMSSNVGLPAAESGVLQINLNYDWNNLQTLKSGDTKLDDQLRQRETHSLMLEMGYTFSPKFSLDLFVPGIRQERTIQAPNGGETFVATNGIGDVVILPKYHFGNGLIAGIGIKLPTGKSDHKSNGIALPADLQPGSGATDIISYLSYQAPLGKSPTRSFFGSAIFRRTGTNTDYLNSTSTYQFGNELQIMAGVSDRWSSLPIMIDPSIQVRYRKAGRDFFNDNEFPSSGGDFVFITPSLSFVVTPSFSFNLGASLPVYSYVNDTQLSPTVRLKTGISFQTHLKSKNHFSL